MYTQPLTHRPCGAAVVLTQASISIAAVALQHILQSKELQDKLQDSTAAWRRALADPNRL